MTKPAPPNITNLPKLQQIEIQFQTNDDDKDDDTRLTVTFQHGPLVFATIQPGGGLPVYGVFGNETDDFSDGHTTPWLNVPINAGTVLYKEDMPVCTTEVRIDPLGHDTWRFNYWTRLHYSDGTMTELHFDQHALSQDVRSNTFPLRS